MTSISGAASWLEGAYINIKNSSADWLESAYASGQSSNSVGSVGSYLKSSAGVADLFAAVSQNQISGLGDLAARAAAQRMDAETQKKLEALIKETMDLSFASNLPTSITTAGDGTLDLVANTFTLADGTVLDITTGREVDVTV